MRFMKHLALIALVLLVGLPQEATAQRRSKRKAPPTINSDLYSSLQYREIGPFRGGRSAAVTGVPGKPKLFYFGAAGGAFGKLKTEESPIPIFLMVILVEVLAPLR